MKGAFRKLIYQTLAAKGLKKSFICKIYVYNKWKVYPIFMSFLIILKNRIPHARNLTEKLILINLWLLDNPQWIFLYYMLDPKYLKIRKKTEYIYL